MKYVTFVIMTVLIFGVAAAPIFSNGMVFAQTEKEVAIEKKERTAEQRDSDKEKGVTNPKEQRESDKEQRDLDKTQRDPVTGLLYTDRDQLAADRVQRALDEQQETRYTALKEKKAQLKEKFANMPEEKKQALQGKLDAMKEKRDVMKEKRVFGNDLKERNSFEEMSKEDKKAKLQEIREKRSANREAQKNMSPDDKQAFLDQRLAEIKEKRATYVSPRDQVVLGSDPTEIMCGEGKELVIKVSNGMPKCLGLDTVIILMDRGIITYPE